MRNVFVPGSRSNDSIIYFNHFNLVRGLLKPSCCTPADEFTISCPGFTSQSVSFRSSCIWTTHDARSLTRSVGTVFAKGKDFSLPTSLSGLRYRTEGRNDILLSNTQCETCDECDSGDSSECYCYTHTPDNTREFLNVRALAFTYITEIQQLLPLWLELSVNLDLTLESSPLTKHDMFAPVIRPMEQVSLTDGCSELTTPDIGVFAVMRYDKTLSASIDNKEYEYRENSDTGRDGDTMCFAVDLCKGLESPVYIQVSQPINDLLVSEYLQRYASRQWNIQFNTVTLRKQPILHKSIIVTFWNGLSMIPVEVNVDVSVNAEVGLRLIDKDLAVGLQFSGTADLNHIESAGLLKGTFILSVDTTINGIEQELQISSKDRTAGYYNMRDVEDLCTQYGMDLHGVSFSVSYVPRPEELFFSRLLRFTATTQECNFAAYLPVNSDNNAALGLSLHTTDCPLLALDELIIPDMSHTLNFIGSISDCFGNDFLGIDSPALVIQSELINSPLRLGNLFELVSNANGPDITTVFGRSNSTGYVSRFPMVQVNPFGLPIKSDAFIRNNVFEIVTTSSVFGYLADISVTALSDLSNWEGLPLTVQGRFHSENGSFFARLSEKVVEKLTAYGEMGNRRRKVAQMSLDQSEERLRSINDQYTLVELNVTQAEERISTAMNNIEKAEIKLMQAEREFNNSQENLTDQLDVGCREEHCEDMCLSGNSCENCTRPTFIIKMGSCLVKKKEIRNVRVVPFYRTVTTWTFVLECRLENNQICQDDDCPMGERENCHERCVPVISQVPVFHWKEVKVDVYTYESCNKRVFNGTVPDTCCNIIPCAVVAPDPTCVANNTMCRAAIQKALDDVEQERRELFENVLKARMDLSLAKIAARRANVDYDAITQRRAQLEVSRDRLQDAHYKARIIYSRTLEEIGPLLSIYNSGIEDRLESIFEIKNITFDKTLINSQSFLPLSITFETIIDGISTEYDNIFVYDSKDTESFDHVADELIDIAFFSSMKRSTWLQSRIRRQTQSELTQRQLFDSRCAHLSNIQLFFMEIHTRLREVQESIEASHNGSSQLSQTLSDISLPVDEEFGAYLGLIKSYEELSVEALFTLEITIFSEWQATMELLYSELGSVGEISCDGFADCIQTALDEFQILIDLTPQNELGEEFLSLQSSFPFAKTKLLDLALLSNISIDEGLTRAEPVIKITSAYATDNYWCNEPPVITMHPPAEVNISLGDALQLSCAANSSLAVKYEWKRDGNVLSQFTTNELIIPTVQQSDSANYTCFASNPVGRAESITTSVTVYELPEFYLTPESVVTYFGDDNGAWFACNATAWPYPGWRWFYRHTTNDTWVVIEGENTNELLILNPQEENEGMYACEAFNYHGSIRSEPVTLTLLPFTVSQHQFSLDFTIFGVNQSCNSHEELYESLYALISDTIDGETASVKDFNITEVDLENYEVSMSLVSVNVTTRFLNFMKFTEIANLALPHVTSLRKSVQLIQDLLESDPSGLICPGNEVFVVDDSVVVGRLTYVCPPGQRLNADYLLCLSCEKGYISTEIERSRIANGIGFTENVPVCEMCPPNTYADMFGSIACLPCPRYHTTTSSGATSIEDCIAQPLVLECETASTSSHVDIDCKTNRPPQIALCSFNGLIQHTCSYPLAINRNVSPIGQYSLTITVKDDEGFQAETTVAYSLEVNIRPTDPAMVPPLVMAFINDSPRVQGDSVEAYFALTRPVKSLVCRLNGKDTVSIEKNCSSGHVLFSSLSPDFYTLRVIATNRYPDKKFIKRRFEITNDTERCILHLINDGVSIRDDTVTVEFSSQGPVERYHCHLDKMDYYECSSPVVIKRLAPGNHQLKITSVGDRCRNNKRNLKFDINIEG